MRPVRGSLRIVPRAGTRSAGFVANKWLLYDPTRTLSLRLRFRREMRRRWALVQKEVDDFIVGLDCFGIAWRYGPTVNVAKHEGQFRFETDPKKVELFMDWLKAVEDEKVLDLVRRHAPYHRLIAPLGARAPIPEEIIPWTNPYVQEAYEKGIDHARARLIDSGRTEAELRRLPFGDGSWMLEPQHKARVEAVFSRTWDGLKTVQEVTNEKAKDALQETLTKEISEGIAAGRNPRVVARAIRKAVNAEIEVIGKSRSEMIAQTEISRAHHKAQVQMYRDVDAEMKVTVQASIALGPNPCPVCIEMAANGPYTLDQVEGLIPRHPRCKCSALPEVVVTE